MRKLKLKQAIAEDFIEDSIRDGTPCISVIREIEFLCWKTDNAKYSEALHAFIDAALVIELEQPN